jgi:hypothetical protein
MRKPRVKKTFKTDDEFFEYSEKWREFYDLESLVPEDPAIEEDLPPHTGKSINVRRWETYAPIQSSPKKAVTKKLIEKYKNDPNVDVEYYDEDRPNKTNTR